MLNAEETSQAAGTLAPAVNGSNGSNGHRPAQPLPPHPPRSRRRRPPGPTSRNGLPPGPSIPGPLQMLGFWYRRDPYFERLRARYGTPFTMQLRVPSLPFVVLGTPDQVKALFQAPPDVLYAGDGSSELEKYFGSTGLAYYEEDEHITRRKIINHSTHGEAMKQVTSSIEKVVDEEISSWPRNELIEMFPRVRRLAISVIRHVNFGPAPDRRLDELVDLLNEMMGDADNVASAMEEQYMPPSLLRVLAALPPTGYRRMLKLRNRVDELLYEVIADRRRAGPQGLDTVSVLLGATDMDGKPLTDQEIRNEAMTNFFAGSGTTAVGMSWAIERISREHAVRERLVQEIDAGEDDSYQVATVQELLRRKPPLPQIIPRLVNKPWELEGITYPPGVRLLGSTYLIHHDPAIYPDPYAFRPERFLDKSPGLFTWIPFGGGRRRCLGKAIAELEIKTLLREVFGRFDVRPERPEGEGKRSFMVITRPSRGARVMLSERS